MQEVIHFLEFDGQFEKEGERINALYKPYSYKIEVSEPGLTFQPKMFPCAVRNSG